MLRTDYILKLKLMLAIVSAVLCVRSSFALGYSCFADISNVDAQVSFATYYDNYDFLGSNGVPTGSDARVAFGAESGYGSRHGNAKGMLTGSLTAKYDGESVSDMLYAVNYYDYNGRIVETHSSKHNSEYETARYAYNLAGKVLKQHTIRYNSSLSELSNDVYAYSYDAGDRVLSATLSHNGATPQAIENCSYDGLGRMNQRICPADTVSTQYNIRGWVTRITEGRRFEQVLSYAAGEQSRFNGNISRNLWKHSASDSYSSYTYAYDNADRLVEAVYSGIGDFSTAYAYDANCNITAISRGGMETEVNGSRIDIDDLVLRYNGNQLTRVTDSGEDSGGYGVMEFIDRSNVANEYAYDANGNMTRDLNKGISNITYNLLNLPGEITFSDGRKVKYIYTAVGAKVRTTYFDATGSQTLQVDYLGNYILRNGVVDRILIPSGYIKNDTVYSYVKDYQGNVRSVVRQDGAVVESTDYYPYGTPFTTANSAQPYKYGTKELDRMHGLDLYDSQARWYDSLIGRTSTMDPKAEKYYSLSPYTWCAGNSVRFIDPDGMYLLNEDGSKVDYLNNTLSENADDGVKIIVSALQLTEQGNKVLKSIVSAKHGIHLILSNEANDEKFGYTLTKTQKSNSNENGIYDKTFEKAAIVVIQNNIENKAKDDVKFNKHQLSKLELINIIAVHEGVHATNPTYNSLINTNEDEDTEYLPLKYEDITLGEIVYRHSLLNY